MANVERVINWFRAREGRVIYSMTNRLGPNSYDCSSSVFFALIEAGFLSKGTGIGNTESLYHLEGRLLLPIARNQVQRGDLFVAGVKGSSGNAGGHTGVFVSSSRIIHCSGSLGIAETNASGYMGDGSGLPVYFYRLKGADQPVGNTHNGIAIDNVTNSVADTTVKWLKEKYAPLLTLHMVRADLQPNNVYTVVVDCYSFSTLQYALNRAAADLRITEPGYIQSNMVHNQNSDGTYRIEIRNCNPQMAKRVVPLLSKNLSTDTYANILGKTIVKSPTSYGSFDIRIKGEGFNNHDTPIVVGEIQSYLYALAKLTGDHVKSFKY
ncbi:peptidoglycan amidohydrolase family protein [Vagococcus entomophilus]|uniref:NlpC/P60 domain-containing protein n=1 Tax=Vagococcus entomophilus TaxID=1160095 RepID=A0A430AH60_9ENTE|nr:peptidoglycan amidohydrolase family protein [Vagococcus entomophilus]RSU07262.1 hypothetical protein CBF30_08385 [Vagococcus entomophilus]